MAQCSSVVGGSFDFGLDRRLTKAVARLGYVTPTEVQARVIPLAMQGKDLLVRARTGSGKTAAYALPMLQKILSAAGAPDTAAGTKALVLVPTRELCVQIRDHVWAIMQYCRDVVSLAALSADAGTQQAQLRGRPDVVIATPGRLLRAVQLQRRRGECAALAACSLQGSLETLIVDEADLVLSYGYTEDVRTIVTRVMPKVCQCFLMSATFTDELLALEKLILHNAVVLKLGDECAGTALLQHYVRVPPEDKPLLLYALLKLGIIRGKTVFFVNSVDRCYRVKLLLEQFCVQSAVLNAELPQMSRDHIIDQFNRGIIEYLIATDDIGSHQDTTGDVSRGMSEYGASTTTNGGKCASSHRANTRQPPVLSPQSAPNMVGADFGVQRGVDFKNVDTVVNYDFPQSVEAYMHRIGRTARGGAGGAALSIVTPRSDLRQRHRRGTCSAICGRDEDEAVLARVQQAQLPCLAASKRSTSGIVPLAPQQPSLLDIDMRELDGFRYRVEDVRRAVTTIAVRDARLREIKMEIVNSKTLRGHFHENPRDLQILRHDAHLQPSKVQSHLATIPPYLRPRSMRGNAGNGHTHNTKKRRRSTSRDDGGLSRTLLGAPSRDADMDAWAAPASRASGGGDGKLGLGGGLRHRKGRQVKSKRKRASTDSNVW